MNNPLLDITQLPRFSEININKIEFSIDQVLEENRQKLNTLLTDHVEVNWNTIIEPLEEMDNKLSRVWSPVSHMNSVVNSEELRIVHDNCLSKLSAYSTEISQNEGLYQAYLKIKESKEFSALSQPQKKTIDNALLNFKLSGVALDKKLKKKFKDIKQKLSALKSKFEQNILDATQAFNIHIEEEKGLSGLPEFARAMAKQAAEEDELEGWLFTLDAPSYLAVMTYSDDASLRKEMYTAFSTRASDQGPVANEYDNSKVMEDILQDRSKLAELLSFNNYAELSIANKMAETTDEVLGFLNDLVKKSYPVARQEFEQLQNYAKSEFSVRKLEAWDVAYYSEKLKQKEYGISQEELKPYFPAEKVINGLFQIVHRLYGINITRIEGMDVWHEDVLFYEIKDKQGNIRGQFYLDLYARANKRGGAWMDECISRMQCGDTIQIPVAYLTCNLTPPVGKDPALLTHNEVTTLFHEFGHGLQHMLTQIDASFVSGISGVEWDAVELPSQFMENWCWEKEGLELISAHYQTGEPLPEELFNKLIKAKNFQSAMFMQRQLEFALFDFRLYMEYGKKNFKGIQALLNEVREEVAVVIPPATNRFQHGFSHIFAGGYSAGYYSYKWAEVLSADAFSLFEENGIFDEKTGESFLHNILEMGGSEKAMDLFKKFRGREPEIGALLRHSGLN
jgi:oligopeptidase A